MDNEILVHFDGPFDPPNLPARPAAKISPVYTVFRCCFVNIFPKFFQFQFMQSNHSNTEYSSGGSMIFDTSSSNGSFSARNFCANSFQSPPIANRSIRQKTAADVNGPSRVKYVRRAVSSIGGMSICSVRNF